MDAVCYHAVSDQTLVSLNLFIDLGRPQPRDLDIITVPVPQINDDQVLIKGDGLDSIDMNRIC